MTASRLAVAAGAVLLFVNSGFAEEPISSPALGNLGSPKAWIVPNMDTYSTLLKDHQFVGIYCAVQNPMKAFKAGSGDAAAVEYSFSSKKILILPDGLLPEKHLHDISKPNAYFNLGLEGELLQKIQETPNASLNVEFFRISDSKDPRAHNDPKSAAKVVINLSGILNHGDDKVVPILVDGKSVGSCTVKRHDPKPSAEVNTREDKPVTHSAVQPHPNDETEAGKKSGAAK